MIYVSISIFLFVGGVRVVQTDTSSFLGNFIDMNSYDNGTIAASSNFENTVPTSYSKSGSGSLLSFIDAVGAVKNFLIFMVNILFAPIGVFIGSGIPQIVAIFIAVPLLVGGVLAFIYFIRSGN